MKITTKLIGDIDFRNSFFDGLRMSYINFDKWLYSKRYEIAYVAYEDDKLMAFMYLKVEDAREDYSDISPAFKPKRRVKIGTLKVDAPNIGIGTRLLDIAKACAKSNSISEMYITIIAEPTHAMANFLANRGFDLWGTKTCGDFTESVYMILLD